MKKFILFGTPLLLAGCTVSIDNPAAGLFNALY